jgi:hypothetical protein
MDALDRLPQDVCSKLKAIVSDLTGMTEIQGRLTVFLQDLRDLEKKIIDLKSFESEVEQMPELLRRVVIALVQRLNSSIEGCMKLASQAEEAIRAIDSLPFLPTEGHAQ